MATQIAGTCTTVTTISNQNSVKIHKDAFDISITQPKVEITLACPPSLTLAEGFLQPFTDVDEVIVNHFLGKKTSVTAMDLTGREIKVHVNHNNDNQFTASWNGLMSGTISAN